MLKPEHKQLFLNCQDFGIGPTAVLIVLTGNLERHAGLLEQLREQALAVQCFTTVPEIQQWLEVNHEPGGLIVDCLDDASKISSSVYAAARIFQPYSDRSA